MVEKKAEPVPPAVEERPPPKAAPIEEKQTGGPGRAYVKVDPKTLKRADITFAKKTGETLIKKPGEVNGSAFKIADLKDCNVFIFDHISQIFVDRCENCIIVIGPNCGSSFIRNCTGC